MSISKKSLGPISSTKNTHVFEQTISSRGLQDAVSRNEKRRRVWHWIDKGGADIPPRPMKARVSKG